MAEDGLFEVHTNYSGMWDCPIIFCLIVDREDICHTTSSLLQTKTPFSYSRVTRTGHLRGSRSAAERRSSAGMAAAASDVPKDKKVAIVTGGELPNPRLPR